MPSVTGGLEKLAEIISPSAETDTAAEAVVGGLQRGLKGAQAFLEQRQSAVFGEQVLYSTLVWLAVGTLAVRDCHCCAAHPQS